MMPTTDPQFRPLALKLTRTIFVWATVCALAFGAFQAVLVYQSERQQFVEELDRVATTTVPLLSVLLWDIEPMAVQRQVDLLSQRADVGSVRLMVSTGQAFAAGKPMPIEDDGMRRVFVVPAPGSEDSPLGSLTVQGDHRNLWLQVAHSVGVMLLGLGFLTLMMCAVMAWVVHATFVRPLRQVARFATELTPQTLTTPLHVRRARLAGRDEIDLVVDGFSLLQRSLRSHIDELDERVAQRTRELEEALGAIRALSMTDPLTGCLTRLAFNERMAQEVQRAQRYGRPLAVLFVDIDYFKRINDRYGHLVGDAAIAHVGELLRAHLREGIDWVARYGGEEFVVVLPETALDAALRTGERLRAAQAAQPCIHGELRVMQTLSVGVAAWRQGESLEALLQRADNLLYEAKSSGRNRVVCEPSPLG